MVARWEWKTEITSFVAMAAAECSAVAINSLYKAATFKGLSYFIFIAYSYIIGTLSLAPLSFIFPRREALPPFQLSILYTILLAAILGTINNVCSFKGIEYSSLTLASAIGNLTPAFTFVFAAIFRLEKFDLRSFATQIKILGTMLSISGALVAILYQGPAILSPISSSSSSPSTSLKASQTDWIIGGVLLVFMNSFGSLWYILQGKAMKMYPHERFVSLIYFMCKTIVALPICLVAEANNSTAWKLRLDITLVTIVCAGLFGPSFYTLLNTWVIHLKGPLYPAIFKPFSIAIAAIIGVLFLGETLFLGSVIGATIILVGFYAVIWAKTQEDQESKDCGSDSSNENTPLLQSCSVSTERYLEN